jgi:TonB family protein
VSIIRGVIKRLLFIFVVAAYAASSVYAQSSNPKNPTVVSAVAPAFPAIAATANMNGDVVVEVEVSAEGKVRTAHAVNAHPLLSKTSENAARRWRFAPASDGEKKRFVQLIFTYRTMPPKIDAEELASIFMPPYHIEVRRMRPEPTITNAHKGKK